MTIPGHRVVRLLSSDARWIVYRAVRRADGAAVLLKGPSRPQPHAAEREALRRELALRREPGLAGVPLALELVRSEERPWLVLEDHGGTPLAERLAAGPIDVATAMHVALQVSTILAELHRRDLVHGSIHPGCILLHPETREVVLEDFSLASRGGVDTSPAGRTALAVELLPYCSPEQTGRMNRSTDHRSDFYSLGVTLYELLTGVRPFSGRDALEIVHAHIARVPTRPADLRAEVPEGVSHIVMKLLEKRAEERYQSALGLRADLERAAREWSTHRAVAAFPLGTQDFSERFLLPERLYGRDDEVRALARAFERTCAGETSLTLVAGYSGVGKTSLIQELYRPIVHQHGNFIAGKFDQVVRNIPFGAFIQAFRGLVRQLLTESEDRLRTWRDRLEQALGPNGGVLVEVIPEIERIIGSPPPVPALPAAETQNRFRMVFQDFVGVLASREHPLVVFLDDLQWADAASLDLLPSLLGSSDLHGLLLIGAYRDNEVDESHPLSRVVATLASGGARIERITLGPLGEPDLGRLAADCLHRDDPGVAALARLLVDKTQGNPFFVRQFLKTLWEDGLLALDHAGRRFTFDLDEIARAPMTDNVAELMSRRLQRLSPAAQDALTLAACVGNPFDVKTLAVVRREEPGASVAVLREALEEGLILPVASLEAAAPEAAAESGFSPQRYAFLHDRVQQSAYARLPEASRPSTHLTVGRLLHEEWLRGGADEKVFEVVSHLNLGRALITEASESLALARLNLTAGRRAKSSTAYEAALGYLQAGLALLPESRWQSEYELTFELEREAAEAEYLCGRFDDAERRFEKLLERARRTLDKARVYDLRLLQYENLSRYVEAARIGLEGLRLFGVTFPDDEAGRSAALAAEVAAIEEALSGRSIASLVDLPVLEDPEIEMVLRLLTDVWAPCYVSGDALLPALASARIVRLSILHGNTEDSAYGYVTHAISVGPLRGEYAAAYEWGTLALRVNERFDDPKRRAKIHQQFNAHVTLWRRPLATCIPHAREACRSGLQTGDFAYAGYGALSESWPAFLTGNDLERFVREFTPTLALLQKIRMTGLASAHGVMLGWARALQGRTAGPLSLADASFSEDAFVAEYGDNPFFMTLLHVARLHLAVLFDDRAAALAAARAARALGPWGRGTIWPVLLEFWEALALAAAPAGEDAPQVRASIAPARESLGALSRSCPENYRCFALLLEAEDLRLAGRPEEAWTLHEEAIGWARETESLQHEALANELCGRLWQESGREKVAAVYLGEARRAYREWGAAAKVLQLEKRFPAVAAAPREVDASLDVASVTKAAHALASEIVLEELLRKLMQISLENAGAEHGFFLQEKDGVLVIEAAGRVREESVSVLGSEPLAESTALSRAVVQYVRQTGESVVLGDATADERFAADPYVRTKRPKSILCVPVVHQGRFDGILYLENDLTTDAFTAERVQVLDVLSTQAAISLANARLYREKSQEAERRRLAEEELRRALAEVETLKNRLQAENVYLQEEIRREHNFEEIVGSSPPMLELLEKLERVAPTDATVLLLGETGTGKELLARALHGHSARRDRPLTKVNCGAIPAGLVESELFGHVRGAFTGAVDRRVGRFELADGGTIFLDEVGELPLETQVKLLRVLQEHEFEPVGSSRTIRADVRVVAATNRNLEEEVRAGRFRSDLYYRLSVFPLRVPPLRERPGDVPKLATYSLVRSARKLGRRIDSVSQETMERLMRYAWPGNVRELQNIIERAVILSTGPELVLADDLLPLDGAGRPASEGAVSGAARDGPLSRASEVVSLSLKEREREHILRVLAETNGVIEGESGAARILNLHPSTLRSRMKKLGIQR